MTPPLAVLPPLELLVVPELELPEVLAELPDPAPEDPESKPPLEAPPLEKTPPLAALLSLSYKSPFEEMRSCGQ
jgi:hypothetical protein